MQPSQAPKPWSECPDSYVRSWSQAVECYSGGCDLEMSQEETRGSAVLFSSSEEFRNMQEKDMSSHDNIFQRIR